MLNCNEPSQCLQQQQQCQLQQMQLPLPQSLGKNQNSILQDEQQVPKDQQQLVLQVTVMAVDSALTNNSENGFFNDTATPSPLLEGELEQQQQQLLAKQDEDFPFLTLRKVVNLPRKIKKSKKVLSDLTDTKYDVIKNICTSLFNWTVVQQSDQLKFPQYDFWNVKWSDGYIHEEDLRRMMPFQRINHFPGSHQLGRKNNLAKNLKKMQLLFPDEYDFYPRTWILPQQLEELKTYFYQQHSTLTTATAGSKNTFNQTCNNVFFSDSQCKQLHLGRNNSELYQGINCNNNFGNNCSNNCLNLGEQSNNQVNTCGKTNTVIQTSQTARCFIVKPEASCQGKGIFLTDSFESMASQEHCVVQEYIARPLLIDGLKFDFRVYVLLKCLLPLQIFMYSEGLARFATVPYHLPGKNNFSNLQMHLTNYAINKKNPNFVFNNSEFKDDFGHKRSFSAVMKHLYYQGKDVSKIYQSIQAIIVKAIVSVQAQLIHNYRQCQSREEYNNLCFEILGFDIMLDENLKPWLIEINHTPSFQTDTPLDLQIKKNLLLDTLIMLNLSQEKKIYYDYKTQKKNQKAQALKMQQIQQQQQPQQLTGPQSGQQQQQQPSQLQQQQQTANTQTTQQSIQITAYSESRQAQGSPIILKYSNKLQLGAYCKIYPLPFNQQISQIYQNLIEAGAKLWQDHQHQKGMNSNCDLTLKCYTINNLSELSISGNGGAGCSNQQRGKQLQASIYQSISNSKSLQAPDEESSSFSPVKTSSTQQQKAARQMPNFIQQNKEFLKDKYRDVFSKTCIAASSICSGGGVNNIANGGNCNQTINNSVINIESEKSLNAPNNNNGISSIPQNQNTLSYGGNNIQNNYQHLLQLINRIQPQESRSLQKYQALDVRIQMNSSKFKQFQKTQQRLRQQSSNSVHQTTTSNSTTIQAQGSLDKSAIGGNNFNNTTIYTRGTHPQQPKNAQNRLLNNIINQKHKIHDFILHHEVFINGNSSVVGSGGGSGGGSGNLGGGSGICGSNVSNKTYCPSSQQSQPFYLQQHQGSEQFQFSPIKFNMQNDHNSRKGLKPQKQIQQLAIDFQKCNLPNLLHNYQQNKEGTVANNMAPLNQDVPIKGSQNVRIHQRNTSEGCPHARIKPYQSTNLDVQLQQQQQLLLKEQQQQSQSKSSQKQVLQQQQLILQSQHISRQQQHNIRGHSLQSGQPLRATVNNNLQYTIRSNSGFADNSGSICKYAHSDSIFSCNNFNGQE